MGLFQVTRQPAPEGGTILYLSGTLDEHANVGAAIGAVDGPLVIHMGGIERINSMGVHRWLTVILDLTARQKVAVVEVPYPIAMQANFVASFFGDAEVRSAAAPYNCGACKATRLVVVSRHEVEEQGGRAPTKQCPTCNKTMEFDELDGYFSFFESVE